MAGDSVDHLTPAQVAEILGIPSSTLRVYASEFRRVLSREAQGDAEVAGRAFRHRRYTPADLALLRRAKALLDGGLSYRVALAQLTGDAIGASTARRSRPRLERPSSSSETGPERLSVRGNRKKTMAAVPLPLVEPVRPVEREVVTVVDPSTTAAIDSLRLAIGDVVTRIDDLGERMGRLDAQLEAIRIEVRRLDRGDTSSASDQPSWFRRLIGRGDTPKIKNTTLNR